MSSQYLIIKVLLCIVHRGLALGKECRTRFAEELLEWPTVIMSSASPDLQQNIESVFESAVWLTDSQQEIPTI